MRAMLTAAGVAGAAGLVLVVAGCHPPKGDTGGRVDVSRTTPAERSDPQVLPSALFEFGDQVAQQIARDLKDVPELNGEQRVTVVFGDIVNKTQIVPTSDFEAFQRRVRSQLMQSKNVLAQVRFVEMKGRMDQLIQRETSTASDSERGGRAPERKDLDAATTFFLNGEMYRIERGGERVNTYLMGFNLTRMDDGSIVWENSPYEVKQAR